MSKNPMAGVAKQWFMGVQPIEVGSALGGFAMATMLPGMLIKDTATTGQKMLKLIISGACAAGSGYIFQNVSTRAGQMAVAGGLAGTLAQAIGMFTDIQIGRPGQRALPQGRPGPTSQRGRIGESRYVPTPEVYEAGVQVSVT